MISLVWNLRQNDVVETPFLESTYFGQSNGMIEIGDWQKLLQEWYNMERVSKLGLRSCLLG